MNANAVDYDIAVVGAGPIGMTAALVLAGGGYRTALVGPDVSADETRTVALLKGSIQLMRHIGAWDRMEPAGTAMVAMRLIDDTGRLLRAPTVTFRSEEIGEPYFGVNVPVPAMTKALAMRAGETNGLARIEDVVTESRLADDRVEIVIDDGDVLTAALVVAADGRQSVCREGAGIGVRSTRYPQTAFVLNATHDRDHDGISTEFHKTTGPFTLVPLAGRSVSVVNVVAPDEADELIKADDDTLSDVLTRQSKSLLGRLRPAGPRRAYPLSSQTADRFAVGRTILVGEAAHIMPPIGAQGLNLGLRDVAALMDSLRAAPDVARPEPLLRHYQDARSLDIATRMTAIDLLNRSLLSGFFGFQGARSLGLHALRSFAPLRRLAMREGMLPSYATPTLMRADQPLSGALR